MKTYIIYKLFQLLGFSIFGHSLIVWFIISVAAYFLATKVIANIPWDRFRRR